MEEGERCPNCGAALTGAFCAACGQKRVRRLTFRSVFSDALGTVINLDSKFSQTVIGLTRNPGRVIAEYVDGRRGAYMNPIKYAFFTTSFFLVMIHLFEVPVWNLTGSSREGFMKVFGMLSYLVFLNVLGPALVQRAFFPRRGRNLAECYVFALFCWGHAALLYTVAALLGAYNSFKSYLVIPLGLAAFMSWGLVGFQRTRVWRAIPVAFVMVVSYYFLGGLFGGLIR